MHPSQGIQYGLQLLSSTSGTLAQLPALHRLQQKFCLPPPTAARLQQDHLTYAEYGQADSNNVILYMHGWPGSRIGGSMLHTAAETCGARVIAVDRPGFGASPFSPQHTVANWAGMVQHLADHLQVEQFSVLGVSGGGPFAASCGRFIPAERLTALGLLCPIGPINRTTKAGMAAANALLMAIARMSPMLARGIWRASRQWMLWDEQCMSRFALLDQDKAAMQAAPQVAQAIRAAVLEGLRAGARGVVHEMKLVQRCWGFRLEDIAVKQSFMWHGLKDPIVPYGMAQAYECIPGCHMTYFADETHTTIVINRLSAALKTLAQLQQPTAATLTKSAAAGKGAVDVAETVL